MKSYLIISTTIVTVFIILSNYFSIVISASPSMSPTYNTGDKILVQNNFKLKRGDVVSFYLNGKTLGKRLVAIPGDTIYIKNRKFYLKTSKEKNFKEEPFKKFVIHDYSLKNSSLFNSPEGFPYTLKNNEYWVMGDNRDISIDSRVFGPIKKEDIIGKYLFVLWF